MADPLFNNQLVEGNVGDSVSIALPDGDYTLLQGALPPGITISPDGVISGTLAEAGTYTLIYEWCCD